MNQTTELTCLDKSDWPRGEWDNEPDRVAWIDEDTGYHCIIRRSNSSGALCGYVAVPKNHPSFGSKYFDVPVEVHGGITYAENCNGDEITGICHLDEKKENPVWWLGFDCSHYLDYSPALIAAISKSLPLKFSQTIQYACGVCNNDAEYRNIFYVKREIHSLAKKLKELENAE